MAADIAAVAADIPAREGDSQSALVSALVVTFAVIASSLVTLILVFVALGEARRRKKKAWLEFDDKDLDGGGPAVRPASVPPELRGGSGGLRGFALPFLPARFMAGASHRLRRLSARLGVPCAHRFHRVCADERLRESLCFTGKRGILIGAVCLHTHGRMHLLYVSPRFMQSAASCPQRPVWLEFRGESSTSQHMGD